MDFIKMGIGFVSVAILGIGIGYYIGHSRGVTEGFEQGRAAAAVVNLTTHATSTNPLQNVKTNPYKDIKTNPFQ